MATEKTKLLLLSAGEDSDGDPESIVAEAAVGETVVDIPPLKEVYSYERILSPFHNCLLIFGLLYKSDFEPKRFRCHLGKVYHWFVVILLWINFGRYIAAYGLGEQYGLRMSLKITIHALLFWGAAGATTAHSMMDIRPLLFKKWNAYIANYDIEHDEQQDKKQKKRVRISLGICWTVVILFCGCLIDMDFDSHLQYLLRLMLLPMVDPCQKTETLFPEIAAIISVINIYVVAIVTFQLAYLHLMTWGVIDEFKRFNANFKSRLKMNALQRVHFEGDLEKWRQRHLEITGLAGLVDVGFGVYILVIFASNVPVSSVLIHRILLTTIHHFNEDRFWGVLIQLLVYLIICISVIIMLSNIGARLNQEALACRGLLYSLDLSGDEWTSKRSVQYTTFSAKLNEAHIGLTGWKLFQVNKGNAKAMILMIVTYTFVLTRFCSSSNAPFHCGSYHQEANITSALFDGDMMDLVDY